jgi:hypothetical protein
LLDTKKRKRVAKIDEETRERERDDRKCLRAIQVDYGLINESRPQYELSDA